MPDDIIRLRDPHVEVLVDAGRGADILSVRHRPTDTGLLFSTPWRERADDIRLGLATPTTYDPVAGFIEQYRGGWNTLCPNAGAPRLVHGAPVGFHGEAAAARWEVLLRESSQARLRTSLFSVPVSIERHLVLAGGGALVIEDEVTNDSDVELEIDYVSHPAFGGAFLEGTCTIDTNARTYTADPGTEGSFAGPGTEHTWPWVVGDDEHGKVDLREVPRPGESRMAFGWLSEFAGEPWAAVTNHDLGLTVRLAWDATYQPYAWFWQELAWTEGFPWHRRARALAIEPSSTTTSGPDRRSALTLLPRQSVRIPLTMTLSTKDTA